jgi:hypothetical protein
VIHGRKFSPALTLDLFASEKTARRFSGCWAAG